MLTKDDQLATSQQFVKHYMAKIDRLEAINADLLAVLKAVMPWASKAVADHYNQKAGQRVLDAAVEVIERVDGESWCCSKQGMTF